MKIKSRKVSNLAVQIMIVGRLPGSYCEVIVRTVNFIKEKLKKKILKNKPIIHTSNSSSGLGEE
jgi:hypothetical protein